MSSLNIILGLSGVGKSTVLEEAQLISDIDYETVNYGDEMFEVAKEKGLVDKRDEMKELGVETYKELQKEAAENIFEKAEEQNIILDTHAAIKTPHGYIPGLPKWSIEKLNPDKLVMFTASPQEIFNRSQSDNDRDREHENVEDIREYQEVAREMASTNAVQTGAYLKIIENKNGRAQEAAKELIETIKA